MAGWTHAPEPCGHGAGQAPPAPLTGKGEEVVLVTLGTMEAGSCSTQFRDGGGGGVFAYGGVVTHSVVIDNTNYSGRAGGIWCNGTPLIRNNLVALNQGGGTRKAGGIFIRGGDAIIESCTVVSNSTDGTGGGIVRSAYGGNAGTPTIRNCVVYFNLDGAGSSDIQDISTTWISYTCSPDAISGTGNITADPLLADLAGGDYRLTALSPCIDAGTNLAWMSTATDLDGNDRIIDEKKGTVNDVDMGAYELFVPAAGTVIIIR